MASENLATIGGSEAFPDDANVSTNVHVRSSVSIGCDVIEDRVRGMRYTLDIGGTVTVFIDHVDMPRLIETLSGAYALGDRCQSVAQWRTRIAKSLMDFTR